MKTAPQMFSNDIIPVLQYFRINNKNFILSINYACLKYFSRITSSIHHCLSLILFPLVLHFLKYNTTHQILITKPGMCLGLGSYSTAAYLKTRWYTASSNPHTCQQSLQHIQSYIILIADNSGVKDSKPYKYKKQVYTNAN